MHDRVHRLFNSSRAAALSLGQRPEQPADFRYARIADIRTSCVRDRGRIRPSRSYPYCTSDSAGGRRAGFLNRVICYGSRILTYNILEPSAFRRNTGSPGRADLQIRKGPADALHGTYGKVTANTTIHSTIIREATAPAIILSFSLVVQPRIGSLDRRPFSLQRSYEILICLIRKSVIRCSL